ncbi:hypothetical protein EE612_004777 [Oryza sativa]|nr:hypothetical protein EE612_004777 [Oryza sativa]
MGFISGEELAVTLAPVAVYWLYSGIYEALGSVRALDRYRLHSRRDEESNNMASKKEVVKGVLLQQAIQVAISLAVLKRPGSGAIVVVGGGGATGRGGAVRGGHVRAGRVAVLRAPADALEPVHVPSVPLVAPPRRGPLRVRGAVRPPRGRRAHGGALRRRRVPCLGPSPPRRGLLPRVRHRQGDRRPLRPPGALEPAARRVRQQHGLPRRAPPAQRRPAQLLAAVLRGLGPSARHARRLHRHRAGEEQRRRPRGQADLQRSPRSPVMSTCFC